jgi:hypothetical protein
MTCPMCGDRFDGLFGRYCRCTRADWDRYDAEQKLKAEKAEKAEKAQAEGIALFPG